MKLKGFIGLKKCKDGEIYRFKNGIAKVPGLRRKNHGAVRITLKEFNELNA